MYGNYTHTQLKSMSYSKLLLSFFIFIAFASSSAFAFFNTTHKCSTPQKHALLLFKRSLFSINYTAYNFHCQDYGYYPIMINWNNDIDCCSWDGVSCNPFTGDVIGVDLTCGMLKGIIYPNATLFHLPRLERLNLAYNDFYGSQLLHEIGKLSSSLTHLNLSHTDFIGEIPSEIFFLSKLVSLDLSSNSFDFENQTRFLSNLFQNCTLLEDVWLRSCGLVGNLPSHLNISSLISLDLGFNHLKGRIPDNIFDLQHLEILYLSRKWLALSQISLLGEIPDSIGHFKSLKYLSLSNCGLVGSIPKSLVYLTHLTALYLRSNMLNGAVPSSLFTLTSIEEIDLSYNMFSGVLRNNQFDGFFELDTLLSTLPKLEILDLSFSGLSLVTTNATDYVNPDFWWLSLASCNLTLFPESIRAMKKLQMLDLSDNNIRGRIPDWAGEIGGNDLDYVNLSYNSITSLPLFKWYGLTELYLQSNKIQGPFPPSICNMSHLIVLDMSKNNFSGVIPKCFIDNSYSLWAINLGTNQFNGTIPNVFKNCDGLQGLILNGNQLEGDMPSSLSKCQSLKILDLGNNKLNGTFPGWLGDLRYLRVLVLKSNNFHGTIGTSSSTMLPFQSLQVLDLSHNGFVGHLRQKFFQNFMAMKDVEMSNTEPQYLLFGYSGKYYSIIIGVKGQELEFQRLLVRYTIIDLSRNGFEGEIPNVIGSLNSLKVLNLSHNNLNGGIPHALGNLSSIESLDLSWNQLSKEIPQSLAGITSLAVLNISHNHLVGRIPEGSQFRTFEGSSFGGNSRLCGSPLPKCERQSSPQVEGDDDDDGGLSWKVVILGYGCGTVIGIVLGNIMLSTGKPKLFNEIFDALEHMILKRQNKRRYLFIGK